MKRNAVGILNEESGQGLVEYALILSFVVIGLIALVSALGVNAFELYSDSMAKMP